MLLAAFVFNLGFYMLIPFLAGFLKQELLLSATLVGMVLGVRSFCQQGLFIVGGLLADLFGYKMLIVSGCLLRAIGFGLFVFSDSTLVLFIAAILTGFAGALFTPAAQAYFSRQTAISSAQMFSLVGVARNAGELLGPVCGVLLLSVSFDLLCLISATPFALFALVFAFLIPEPKKSTDSAANLSSATSSGTAGGVKQMIRGVFNNRPFLLFSGLMTGYFMLINQISFAIPIHIVNQNSEQQDVAFVLTLCALVSIGLQLSVTRYCEQWLSPQQWIRIGLSLMGMSFLVLVPSWQFDGLLHYLPLALLALLFTLGTMLSFPFIMSQITELAEDKSVATHFGFFYLFAGFGLIAGSSVTGVAFDLANINPHLAWYSLAAIGLLTALLHKILMPTAQELVNLSLNTSSQSKGETL